MAPSLLWLIAGGVFLALEAFGIPGIGFLFAGIGAFSVGLMIQLGLLAQDQLTWQIAAFLINSSILALLLWKRMKHWRSKRADVPYSNMIGDEAIVIDSLVEGTTGEVKWSGTTMRAKLQGASSLPAGTQVVIAAVEGNVLTVRPK